MTVWIVIIISGLMTNIHDPLMVVVPCLSAGPAVLSLGCSNQSNSPQPIPTPILDMILLMMMMMSVLYLEPGPGAGDEARTREMRPGCVVWRSQGPINTSATKTQRGSRALGSNTALIHLQL